MDQRERLNDPQEALRVAMEGHQAQIWTSLPGILQSYDADKLTASVQPAVQGRLRQEDGTWKDVNLPLLLDCPVIFPAGGGFVFTFPLKKDDEGLVVFSSRCIDSWWYSGGVQKQARAKAEEVAAGNNPDAPTSASVYRSGSDNCSGGRRRRGAAGSVASCNRTRSRARSPGTASDW